MDGVGSGPGVAPGPPSVSAPEVGQIPPFQEVSFILMLDHLSSMSDGPASGAALGPVATSNPCFYPIQARTPIVDTFQDLVEKDLMRINKANKAASDLTRQEQEALQSLQNNASSVSKKFSMSTQFKVYAYFSLNPAGFLQAMAMKFTVEEINNSTTLLPGQILGYKVYDTCLNSLAILHPTLLFLARNGTEDVEVMCNLTDYKTEVIAVIGPSSIEEATVPTKLFSAFLIPQISYAVTADEFSDKTTYPSFLRTVPSDIKQVSGMVALMAYFQWNWIAAVASDDDYGTQALQQFSSSAIDSGICLAYEGIIPLNISDSAISTVIESILDGIVQAEVNVVLVFSSLPQSIALFQEVIGRNMTQVWIGSASWVLSESVLSLTGIERVGTVIGFFPEAQIVPGFDGFLRNAISQLYPPHSATQSMWASEGYQNIDLNPDAISAILHPLTALLAQSVYTAVYAVAYALDTLLNCNSVMCNKQESKIYPWKLLEVVKNVTFSIFNTSFNFDRNGNPNVGYYIVTHSFTGMGFINIGSYNGELDLNISLINWGTKDNQMPRNGVRGNC
ncbi:taste receptor type 1 member 3 [Hyperolius riggenbachi]|uniref:taste receptor type 1 member 3 n=1 Tax=Hyperolius riggenbachi TaxID=752182 RepID=UPI0035A2E666